MHCCASVSCSSKTKLREVMDAEVEGKAGVGWQSLGSMRAASTAHSLVLSVCSCKALKWRDVGSQKGKRCEAAGGYLRDRVTADSKMWRQNTQKRWKTLTASLQNASAGTTDTLALKHAVNMSNFKDLLQWWLCFSPWLIEQLTQSLWFETLSPATPLNRLYKSHWLHNLLWVRSRTLARQQVLLGWRLFKVALKWFQHSWRSSWATCFNRKYSGSTYFLLWNAKIQTWPSHDWGGITC